VQLGADRLIRIGTCGGLQPDLELGDTIIALSAVPADGTARAYTQGEPHAPTAHFGLTHGAIHAAKGLGIRARVGAIASSDTFYDPDPQRHRRWAERGVLAVEMEAAVLFAVGGDGTVSEVANGLAGTTGGTELAIIQRGSGCDIMRTFGIPKDADRALEVAATAPARTIDLGRVEYTGRDGVMESRHFINIA